MLQVCMRTESPTLRALAVNIRFCLSRGCTYMEIAEHLHSQDMFIQCQIQGILFWACISPLQLTEKQKLDRQQFLHFQDLITQIWKHSSRRIAVNRNHAAKVSFQQTSRWIWAIIKWAVPHRLIRILSIGSLREMAIKTWISFWPTLGNFQ